MNASGQMPMQRTSKSLIMYVLRMNKTTHVVFLQQNIKEWPYFLFVPHSQKSYVRLLTSRSLNKIAHLAFCNLQQNMQYSQTFQFLLFTRHHQEFCLSAFFLLFTCKLGMQKFIWVDVGMSFRIINFLKYLNNAIVFDSRLINAINFLPD